MSTNNSFISFMAYIAILACSQNEVAIAKEFIKETRTVCITQGCLEGKTLPGYQTHAYEAFLGIPFAEPPIGELRFANPLPAKPWTGTYDAKQEKPNCIQKNYLIPNPVVEGQEDCLYLNVYRPYNTSSSTDSLSVMVYIHGGGFFAGSPSALFHGPEYFMDNGEVILVLMAYRLGALGFLSTGDEHSPGNFGLKDQTLALKWVNENIKNFGGNPNSITIFGTSAGGCSTHMHMISPLSKGLFHRAIVMSGMANSPFNNPTKKPLALARQQAELVGILNAENLSNSKLIQRLRHINVTDLVNSGDGLRYWSIDPLTIYRTVIEKDLPGAFLTEQPAAIWRDGRFKHVPWMVTVVPNEGIVRSGAIWANKELLEDFNNKIDYLLPKILELSPKNEKQTDQINTAVKKFYLNGSSTVTENNRNGFMQMFTDRAFHHPLYKSIESYLQYADTKYNPVYHYRFSYKGPISYSAVFTSTTADYGVGHLDDLIYMFRTPAIFPEFPKKSQYAALITDLINTLVNFAKTGKPLIWDETHHCDKDHQGDMCDYQEFRNLPDDSQRYEIRTEDSFDMKMVDFWDELLNH